MAVITRLDTSNIGWNLSSAAGITIEANDTWAMSVQMSDSLLKRTFVSFTKINLSHFQSIKQTIGKLGENIQVVDFKIVGV